MKKIFKFLWSIWEYIFAKIERIHVVGNKDSLLRISIKKYHGKRLVLNDGTVLNPNDKYGELHLNNYVLSHITSKSNSPVYIGITTLREFKKSLRVFKKLINENAEFSNINVFMGYSLFNQGIERLGFQIIDIKSPIEKFIFSNYEKILLAIFHPEGFERLRNNNFVSKLVIITRKTIDNDY